MYFPFKCGQILLFFIQLYTVSHCGTQCPSRGSVYPCLCTNAVQYHSDNSSSTYTLVTCRHVHSKDVLTAMFNTLRSMLIDRFTLYDSFWQVDKHATESERNLPHNWISQLRIKELDVIDTRLSSCFACDISAGCPNLVPTRISFYNSSSAASICSSCESEQGKFSWMACMPKLQQFDFVGNKLKYIPSEFFLMPMRELKIVNMSHNDIGIIAANAFTHVPKMEVLDLSHNKITHIYDGTFGDKETALTHLDLSNNQISSLSSDIFKINRNLVTFNAKNNFLEKLKEQDWKYLPPSLTTLNLLQNLIECDCNMTWINRTINMNVNLMGNCIAAGYGNLPLRVAYEYMTEQCNELQHEILLLKNNGTENTQNLNRTRQ